jgi:hypothetical protein
MFDEEDGKNYEAPECAISAVLLLIFLCISVKLCFWFFIETAVAF